MTIQFALCLFPIGTEPLSPTVFEIFDPKQYQQTNQRTNERTNAANKHDGSQYLLVEEIIGKVRYFILSFCGLKCVLFGPFNISSLTKTAIPCSFCIEESYEYSFFSTDLGLSQPCRTEASKGTAGDAKCVTEILGDKIRKFGGKVLISSVDSQENN